MKPGDWALAAIATLILAWAMASVVLATSTSNRANFECAKARQGKCAQLDGVVLATRCICEQGTEVSW